MYILLMFTQGQTSTQGSAVYEDIWKKQQFTPRYEEVKIVMFGKTSFLWEKGELSFLLREYKYNGVDSPLCTWYVGCQF